MPGVPTSKGCDACRRAKKKCDELQPCSRCRRLQVSCEGSGKQRYKFKNADNTLKVIQAKPRKSRAVATVASYKISPQLPDNEVLSCFISTLQIHDVRYDITYYGPFLRDLPRRLGHSPALDASIKSLVTSYPYFHSVPGREVPHEVFVNFGQSLRVLRETLSDPKECHSPDTLCAIYLISVTQSWLGDINLHHGEAIAHILRNMDLKECTGRFERELVAILAVPLILEGISNPRLRMENSFWDNVKTLIRGYATTTQEEKAPQSPMSLSSISMLPEFMVNPDAHLSEITTLYLQLRVEVEKKRTLLANFPPGKHLELSSMRVGAIDRPQSQAAYAMTLSLTVITNALMRVFDPENTTLINDAAYFCDEIADEAELASCYRPLGSAYAALCLVVALATAEDPRQIARVERILADYQSDFRGLNWDDRVDWLRRLFAEHRMRVALGREVQSKVVSEPGLCIVM